ncbi:MAG: Uma2 family endonuclease [Cytophagales bacterium]
MEALKEKSKIKSVKSRIATQKEKFVKPLYSGLEMDLEEYQVWKPDIIDSWKYELIDGKLEANEEKMKQKEAFILKNITRNFSKTIYWQNGGELFSEMRFKSNISNTVRIPDLCFLSESQIIDAKNEINIVPSFIIEIVSTFDQTNGYEQKLREYFQNGVQCLWLIYPIFKEVKVYTSIRDIKICLEQDICSASPALPDFELVTEQIFE